MAIKTIGQVLKEKRTALGLSLSEAEELTNIQKLYIVALETDDYKALPGEFYIKAYLKQYAEKLELDSGKIIQAYDRGEGITVEDKEDILETYRFVKPSERVDEEEEEEAGPKTWRDYIPIITLSSVAVLILLVVIAAVIINKPETPNLVSDDYTYANSTSKSEASKSSETTSSPAATTASTAPATPTQSIAVTGSGSAITATLSNATTPVKVEITSSATNNIWVGITHSDLAAGAQTLTSTANTLSTTLTTGATSSQITLGSVPGITLTVNGQNVDLSALTTSGVGKITLQIQPASTTAETAQTGTSTTTDASGTTSNATTTTASAGQ